ncbi:unnamed protein product [Soboliphyme baturini]|uniref:Uncharacterized protein n=1 Tax=Soboliphyme baturini TaxID=241478 RepID=A0A183IJ18_9BILA|nr:unnamed protein product [Soboliphyme baturini]
MGNIDIQSKSSVVYLFFAIRLVDTIAFLLLLLRCSCILIMVTILDRRTRVRLRMDIRRWPTPDTPCRTRLLA